MWKYRKIDKQTLRKWKNDPDNWRWGIFYFNPQDPRIFPQKRTTLGWTINFANPTSIVVVLGSIILFVLLMECLY